MYYVRSLLSAYRTARFLQCGFIDTCVILRERVAILHTEWRLR